LSIWRQITVDKLLRSVQLIVIEACDRANLDWVSLGLIRALFLLTILTILLLCPVLIYLEMIK
jgi:hypothetical protein